MKADEKKNTLAIIPARGGSKGIPRKNIIQLHGKPLIAHSINCAKESKYVNRVVVSTDDEEISRVAIQYGAEVVMRPSELSGDDAPSEQAIIHTLEYLGKSENYEPDIVVFLQATSPYRLPDDIDGAILKLQENNCDCVFSACPEHFTGRWRITQEFGARPVNYEIGSRQMRQNYPIEYLENGSIYVFKPWVILQTNDRLGGEISIYEMPALRSFQIDSVEDFELLEHLLSMP